MNKIFSHAHNIQLYGNGHSKQSCPGVGIKNTNYQWYISKITLSVCIRLKRNTLCQFSPVWMSILSVYWSINSDKTRYCIDFFIFYVWSYSLIFFQKFWLERVILYIFRYTVLKYPLRLEITIFVCVSGGLFFS